MAPQPFTKNSTDRSNDTGYQFEFHCDKCGSGYRSSFQTSKLGMAASVLRAAGSLLGGRVASLGYGADQMKDALRGEAWDQAYQEAIAEIRPRFHQCTKCGQWVCPDACWNEARGLCETCAPDLQEHAASIQAQVAVEQVWTKARGSDQTAGLDLEQEQTATCGKCQATLTPGAKFCMGCGAPVGGAAKRFCTGCGTELSASARFCPGCGEKAG
jgi:hypothetical protein